MAGQERTAVRTTGSRGQLTSDMVRLYNTSYRTSYARGIEKISSGFRRPCGTGFTANQRPAIYYKPIMDHVNNPQFGPLVSDRFMSETKRHYQPHIWPDCSVSSLNLNKKPGASGFHQLRCHLKTATAKEKTEYQRLFVPPRLTPTVYPVTVGPKGNSGFTEGTDLQPMTFQERKMRTVEPHQCWLSVTKQDFMLPSFLQGTEARLGLRSFSSRETGFTRGATALLACPTSLLPSPQTKSNAPTKIANGKKEPTGSLVNAFPNAPFDGPHFTTQYKSFFGGHTHAGLIHSEMDSSYNRRCTGTSSGNKSSCTANYLHNNHKNPSYLKPFVQN